MKSRLPLFFSLAAMSTFAVAAHLGCGSDGGGPAPAGPCKAKAECTPDVDHPLPDIENPPTVCGPIDSCAPPCSAERMVAVKDCPTNNACMAPVMQSGDVSNLRMGRIRLFAPDSLLAITAIAVDPNVNPKCLNNGTDEFSWLMQIDKKANNIKTGGARKSLDGGKTYAFLAETVDASKIGEICPGFEGPTKPVDLAPITSTITFTGQAFSTKSIDLINVPIFDATSGVPIILPLRDAFLKNVTLSADGTCIGKWEKDFWCDGDTIGWTTGGNIVGKITVEDADRVPVKSASCQSLCAILANDLTKTTKNKAGNSVCKRNADGVTYPEIGDSCAGGGASCKNAFRLAAGFGAYGINITGSTPPPPTDAGPDTGSDTGTDSGTDTGASDATDGG